MRLQSNFQIKTSFAPHCQCFFQRVALSFFEAPTDGYCNRVGQLLEDEINIHILSHGPGNEFQVMYLLAFTGKGLSQGLQ